jgi:hypothetical protein
VVRFSEPPVGLVAIVFAIAMLQDDPPHWLRRPDSLMYRDEVTRWIHKAC